MKTRIELKLDPHGSNANLTVVKVVNRTDVLPGDRLTKYRVDELINISQCSTRDDLTVTIVKK